jgi:hypothetical protein
MSEMTYGTTDLRANEGNIRNSKDELFCPESISGQQSDQAMAGFGGTARK